MDRISLYAIGGILDRLDPMLREIPGVIEAQDPEYLHRMRVASRRLRMALRLLGSFAGLSNAKAFFRLARAVTRTLGEARDLDVQLCWLDEFAASCSSRELPGVKRVALRLRQRREAAQPEVARLVANLADEPVFVDTRQNLREKKLNTEMSGTADPLRDLEHPTRVVCLQLDTMHQYALSLQSPGAVAMHHQLRIEAKHLRYAMEIFGDLYEGALDEYIALAKKLQTLLGELHDADVWVETMPRFTEREKNRTIRYYGSVRPFSRLQGGCEAIARDREDFRASQYEKAKGFWEEAEREGKWSGLRELVMGAYRRRGMGLSDQM